MNAFEARQLMGIEPQGDTEESIFQAIDAVIYACASNGYDCVHIVSDSWLSDLVDRYMRANGFLECNFFGGTWTWGGCPMDYDDMYPTFHFPNGELEFPERGTYRMKLAYKFELDIEGKRVLVPCP